MAAPAAAPELVAAILPPDPAAPETPRLALAAYAQPWPGRVDVQQTGTGAALARLTRPAVIGTLLTALQPGPIDVWDNSSVTIELAAGHVASIGDDAALDGGNRLAIETDAGLWEVIGFAAAELVGTRTYRLSRLLRGLGGSDPQMGPAAIGRRVLLLDSAVWIGPVAADWIGGALDLRAYAGAADAVGTAFSVGIGLDAVQCLPPAHLSAHRGAGGDIAFSWIRRSRADTGSWAVLEVPLEASPEAYVLEMFDGATSVRTLTATASTASYAAAEQSSDFGSLPTGFAWTVRQQSPSFGDGHAARGDFGA